MKLTLQSIIAVLLVLIAYNGWSQASPDYEGGYKIKFNEKGSKYLRILSWGQFQTTYNSDPDEKASSTQFNMRRARVMLFSQINKDFLILTHFGLNSLKADNMHPVGKNDNAELFIHEAMIEYNFSNAIQLGAGIHYWNGISRANNQSTLNMLTLDNNRQSWSTLGLSDQFGRHIGVYAKGSLGKLQYRVSVNDATVNSLDAGLEDGIRYNGVKIFGTKEAGKTYAGYFDYNFLDQESNFLPYKVGTYLGAKSVFNLGVGFFSHPSGVVEYQNSGEHKAHDVSMFSVDAFYDAPLGADMGAVTSYLQYQTNNLGDNYAKGTTYGTGNMLYGHLGYVLPKDLNGIKFQPYLSYALNQHDAYNDDYTVFSSGMNFYLSGNNCKLTLDYKRQSFAESSNLLTLQAMIYL